MSYKKVPMYFYSLFIAPAAIAATLNPDSNPVGLVDTDAQYSMTPFKTHFTEDCILSVAEQMGIPASDELGTFKLGCNISEVYEKLKKDPQPGLQVLALRMIRDKIIEEKEAFRRKSIESSELASTKKKFALLEGLFLKSLPVQDLPSLEKLEFDFVVKAKPYVEVAEQIYSLPDKLLSFEKAYYRAQIMGESLHFAGYLKVLSEIPNDDLKHDSVAWAAAWYERYATSKSVLRPWLFERSLALRPKRPQDAASDRDLFYWLLSFELYQPEEIKSQKKEILNSLRALWINYPALDDAQRIRKTADVIGLSREFSPPGINQMDFPETLLRAYALMKKMDYEGAQKALRRLWNFDSKNYPPAQAFEALQLHIKILRYADSRPKIPDIIKKYLSWAPEIYSPFSPNLKSPDLASHLSRGIELAKSYWTYSNIDQALALVEEILELSRKASLSANYPQLLYIRARIAEQLGNREAALVSFEEALKTPLSQDMKTDLFWRYFYLHFEKATPTGTLTPLFAILDRIKKELPGIDDARLFYWQGKVFTLNLANGKNKAAAIKQFQRAYQAEAFAFYSNLAGLELSNLGVSPQNWVSDDREERKLFAPIWANYITREGEAQKKEFTQLTRLFHLSKIRERKLATKAFADVDRSVWSYLLASKNSSSSKTEFGQAIAWLRFSLGDAMGGLKAAEVLRMGLKGKLGAVEQSLLYPLPYWEQIKDFSEKFGANPWLAASLIRQESAFNPRAKSFANAMGLMQMIPPVAAQEAKKLKIEDFTNEMLYHPPTALRLGTFHLGGLIKSFEGSWICAVASYNAGQPPVHKWVKYYSSSHPIIFIERISYSETRNYVKAILRNYINYQRIYGKGIIDTANLFDLPFNDKTIMEGPAKKSSAVPSATRTPFEFRSSTKLL